MLLAININNTQIKVGGYRGSDLLVHWRIATDLNKTDDEYAMILRGVFQYAGLEFAKSAPTASATPSRSTRSTGDRPSSSTSAPRPPSPPCPRTGIFWAGPSPPAL